MKTAVTMVEPQHAKIVVRACEHATKWKWEATQEGQCDTNLGSGSDSTATMCG
jgi:hypothetical protein